MAVYRNTINRTYQLDRQTATRVKALAVARGVLDSGLVDLLLTYALDAVDAGRLDFRRRPVAWVIDRGEDAA